jgi:hypothetical protein
MNSVFFTAKRDLKPVLSKDIYPQKGRRVSLEIAKQSNDEFSLSKSSECQETSFGNGP